LKFKKLGLMMLKLFNLSCPICRSPISFNATKSETSCSECYRVIRLYPDFLPRKHHKVIFGVLGLIATSLFTLLIRSSEFIQDELAILAIDFLFMPVYYFGVKSFYLNFQRVIVTPPKDKPYFK